MDDDDGSATIDMERADDGYFSAHVPAAGAGTRYRFRSADGTLAPDPASRYQPEGPHGPSCVIDPSSFPWTDAAWRGPPAGRQVVYELHVGTFTRGGTWRDAIEQLPYLASLGITIIEVMPVAEYAGRFGWGYDGVAFFAPTRNYGTPDDMRAFVDRAHALGLAVILDVVYNHTGPDGCYMPHFADEYFSRKYETDWGDALNFDDTGSGPVREFYLANAEYWIREFHLDGLRLDATQNIYDDSARHIIGEVTARARAAADGRRTWIVAENEPQDTRMVRADEHGFGMDAMWNDDFHHSAMVALTGKAEAYYTDYRGTPQELISAARFGFLYQGQYYAWQKHRRGTATFDIAARCMVNFLQNHDQVANSDSGRRVHDLTSPGELRALTALLLLMPGTAMLFQGQEFAASSPFVFFADHRPELAAKVHAGRREFLKQFPSIATADMQERIQDPADARAFTQCVLDHDERRANEHVLRLHTDLIALSRSDPVFAKQDASRLHGAVLGERALVLRYVAPEHGDRLLLVNLGTQLHLEIVPEPLLAPPPDAWWQLLWSSEEPRYGGHGVTHPEQDAGWMIPGRAAVVLMPVASDQPVRGRKW